MSAGAGRVVVVGGGIIGLACAHYLAKSGASVTVIEKGEVGHGASWGNCGLVCPSHVLPLAEPGAVRNALRALFERNSPFVIRPRLDPALGSWLLRFASRCNRRDMIQAGHAIQALLESSLRLYEELVDRDGLACEWQKRGLLFPYKSPEAMDAFTATDDLLGETFHCRAQRLDAEALLEFEPALLSGLAGGWYYEDDAHLRPDVLIRSWTCALEAQGVTFVEHCQFQGFRGSSDRAEVVATDRGDYPADRVVVATGALTPLLKSAIGCALPIQPGKGYSLTMPRPAICPKVPLIFPETRVAVTPFQTGYRLGSTMEFAGYDDTIRPERIQLLRDGARPYLREPYCEPVIEQWFGWRPMTHDSLPVIDWSPARSNVLIAAGHNMLGLSMAPATGKLVAEILTATAPHIDPAPYRLTRFTSGG